MFVETYINIFLVLWKWFECHEKSKLNAKLRLFNLNTCWSHFKHFGNCDWVNWFTMNSNQFKMPFNKSDKIFIWKDALFATNVVVLFYNSDQQTFKLDHIGAIETKNKRNDNNFSMTDSYEYKQKLIYHVRNFSPDDCRKTMCNNSNYFDFIIRKSIKSITNQVGHFELME